MHVDGEHLGIHAGRDPPVPALTYQVAALVGRRVAGRATTSSTSRLHAGNALLVLGIARARRRPGACRLRWRPPSCSRVLPMQTESVAWVTGRVDSMPAFFYLAAFLLYVPLARGGAGRRCTSWSVAACFVGALLEAEHHHAGAGARGVRPRHRPPPSSESSWAWLRPYVPFVLLTGGYLLLRYAVFGQVARESMLTPRAAGCVRPGRVYASPPHGLWRTRPCDVGGARRDRGRHRGRGGRVNRGAARSQTAARVSSAPQRLLLDHLAGSRDRADPRRGIRVAAPHVPGVGRLGDLARNRVRGAVAGADRRA